MLTLILGPVRSGKSARAAALAQVTGKRVVLVATAAVDPADAEMRDRVERHRRDRPASWGVVETAQLGSPSLVEREQQKFGYAEPLWGGMCRQPA